MSKTYPSSNIHFTISGDKASPATRVTRGVMITNQAPQAALYAAPEIKGAADGVIKSTAVLKEAIDDVHVAEAALAKAKTALGAAVVAWDGAYDILLVNAEKKCQTPDDGASLALPVRAAKAKNALAAPVGVGYDVKIDALRIHVLRAPGMRAFSVQLTQDPTNPASWKDLDGTGSMRVVPHPVSGTWWVRAASSTSKQKSDYTVPVSVTVR